MSLEMLKSLVSKGKGWRSSRTCRSEEVSDVIHDLYIRAIWLYQFTESRADAVEHEEDLLLFFLMGKLGEKGS